MEPGFRAIDPWEPVELSAGPVTLTLQGGAVRWIRALGVEVIRGINVAVRGPGWVTLPVRFDSCDLWEAGDSFRATLKAHCDDSDGPVIAWNATISGASEGTIAYSLMAQALCDFITPRVGLCVLHPPRLAGARVDVKTPFATMRGRLPVLVTHLMPFSTIHQIRQDRLAFHETTIDFAGDLFEMEDQRAFGDASFKTFSRPLALPAPYLLAAGTVVNQSVTVSLPRARPESLRKPTRARLRAPTESLAVRLGDGLGHPMPRIGTGVAPRAVEVGPDVRAALAGLGVAHLGACIDLQNPDADLEVDHAARAANDVEAGLDLALIPAAGGGSIAGVLRRLAAEGVPITRIAAFDRRTHTTTASLANLLREAARETRSAAVVFGGTRAYLYHLVAEPFPAQLDGIICPVSPQVHAFDDATIMESIEVLRALVDTASSVSGGLPVAVGPVALRPQFNPDTDSLEAGDARPASGALPQRYDRRQVEALGGAWTVGVVGALAVAGVVAVTIHEAAGWGGLVAAHHDGLPEMGFRPGEILPAGHATGVLAGMTGELLATEASSPRVAAVATRAADGSVQAVVANLDRTTARVRLDLGPGCVTRRVELLTRTSEVGWRWRSAPEPGSFELEAHAVARVSAICER